MGEGGVVGDVAVLFGGPSPEHDVSVLTGLQAARELAGSGRRTKGIYWSKLGAFFEVDPSLEASEFIDGVPKGSHALTLVLGDPGGFFGEGGRRRGPQLLALDAVVLCTHGGPGEDGSLQASLDLAGLRYTGPTLAGASLGMDKLAFGAVISAAGLPSLPRVALTPALDEAGFDGPYIVKPRFGGSSIGIDVVADLEVARARLGANVHLANGAVLEPYRGDLHDLQVAVRSYPARQLSAIERPLRSGVGSEEILGYADKYVGGEGMASAPRELPAKLGEAQAGEVLRAADRVAELAGVRGVARIDFLANDDEVYVNEINTIPGSLARYLFIEPPLSFGELLDDLIAEALATPTHRYSAAGADGLVLRGASSIASKLA
jgi:D-alanine-D-alanine ligase